MLAPSAARGGIRAASLRNRASFHSIVSDMLPPDVGQGSARSASFSTSSRPLAHGTLLGGPRGSELPPGGVGGAAGSRAVTYSCAPASGFAFRLRALVLR